MLNHLISDYLEAQKAWRAQDAVDDVASNDSDEWHTYMRLAGEIIDYRCSNMLEIRHKAQFILSEEELVDTLANCSTDAAFRDFLGSMILPVEKSNSGENC